MAFDGGWEGSDGGRSLRPTTVVAAAEVDRGAGLVEDSGRRVYRRSAGVLRVYVQVFQFQTYFIYLFIFWGEGGKGYSFRHVSDWSGGRGQLGLFSFLVFFFFLKCKGRIFVGHGM